MLLIQQMLMMMWEAILEYWGIVMALLGGLIIAWVLGKLLLRRRHPNHRLTGLFSELVAVVAFFMLPKFFSASLAAFSSFAILSFSNLAASFFAFSSDSMLL